VVAARFSLPTEALSRRYARGSASEAKNMAVHVARELGVPLAQIAFAMCVSRQRASRMAMDHSEARRELVGEIVQSLRSDLDAVR
jgi:hypothetical protein